MDNPLVIIGVLTLNKDFVIKTKKLLDHKNLEVIHFTNADKKASLSTVELLLIDEESETLLKKLITNETNINRKQIFCIVLTSKELEPNKLLDFYKFGINDVINISTCPDNIIKEKLSSTISYISSEKTSLSEKKQLKYTNMVTNEGFWYWDRRKDQIYFSPTYYTMLGYDVNEFKGSSKVWRSMIHPDDINQATTTLKDFLSKKNKSFTIEFRIRSKTNDYFWIRAKGLSIREDEKGRPLHFIGTLTNIHHEMLALMVLQESELKYKSLVEQVNDWIWETNEHGVYTYSSPKIMDILGYKSEEVLGHTLYEFMPNEQAEKIKLEFAEIEKRRIPFFQLINTCKHKNGRLIYLETSGTPIFDKTKKFKGYRGIDRNITDRIKSETLIKESEEKFRKLFNYLTDAIVITTLDGKIIDVNKASIDMLGKNMAELLEIDNLVSFYPQNQIQVKEYLETLLNSGSASFESEIEKTYNHKIYLETKGRIIEHKGEPALLHIARDISLRKDLEQKLLQVIIDTEENERTRFAKDLHDGLGPQLSAVKLYINSIGLDHYSPEKKEIMIQNAKDIIDKAIISTKEIANNLMPSVLSNFGLIDAVKRFCDDINKTEVIKIDLNILETFSRLESNKEIALYRIIFELINNTLKHAKATKIDLSMTGYDKNITLEYSDNGIGFNMDEIIDKKSGLGLKNITSRIKSINGNIIMVSESGKGFYAKINVME